MGPLGGSRQPRQRLWLEYRTVFCDHQHHARLLQQRDARLYAAARLKPSNSTLASSGTHAVVPYVGTDVFSDTFSCVPPLSRPPATVACGRVPSQQLCAHRYIMPSCRELDVEEIVTKSIGAVTFTTSIIETIELAYPCNAGSADAAAKQARCAAWNVTVEQSGVQCRCSHSEVYYVKGIERMGVAFEHAYTTTEKVNGGLAGSSAVVGEKLDTKVHWGNGTEHECTPRHLALPRQPETKPPVPSPPMHHVAHPQWRVYPSTQPTRVLGGGGCLRASFSRACRWGMCPA